MEFQVVISKDEDKRYVAECVTLPGCVSDGKTKSEALRNITEAIEGYLESLKKHKEPLPFFETEKVRVKV